MLEADPIKTEPAEFDAGALITNKKYIVTWQVHLFGKFFAISLLE